MHSDRLNCNNKLIADTDKRLFRQNSALYPEFGFSQVVRVIRKIQASGFHI
jgi:hypothetical protein